MQLYRWLECPDTPVHPSYSRAVQIIMLTGQRVEGIARLHVDSGMQRKGSSTGRRPRTSSHTPFRSHCSLQSIKPNQHGWYFPWAKDPSKPVSHMTLYSFVWRQRDRGVIPYATNRDPRRTFKTLAGKAGVSKEIRDRLQNHALQDVSSKNYHRWNYMPEKRAGMAKWDKFVRAMLAGKRLKTAA